MSQAQTAHQDGDERYNELAHKVFLILNEGQLHRAPLVEPKVALDLGCGSGIWALEFAKAYPSCQVLGIDINPGSGDQNPTNFKFVQGDIEKAWDWLPARPVDFLTIRGLFGILDNWTELFRKAMSCLAPGGWIEVADVCYMTTSDDGSLDNAKGLLRFDAMYRKALNQMNPNLGTLSSLYEKMVDVGFQSCSVTKRKIPVSDMSTDPELNEISKYSLEIHEMDTAIISERALQPILNLSTKEVETVLADALRDMRDKNIHAYRYGYVFCAQKPLES